MSVTIALTHATLVDQPPLSAQLASLGSTLLDLPVLLLAPLEPAPLTESANALTATSIPTSVCPHAPLASAPLEDNAPSALITALPALEPPLPVPAA